MLGQSVARGNGGRLEPERAESVEELPAILGQNRLSSVEDVVERRKIQLWLLFLRAVLAQRQPKGKVRDLRVGRTVPGNQPNSGAHATRNVYADVQRVTVVQESAHILRECARPRSRSSSSSSNNNDEYQRRTETACAARRLGREGTKWVTHSAPSHRSKGTPGTRQ